MAIVYDHLAYLADRLFVDEIICGPVAAVPGSLVVYQHMNSALLCRVLDGPRIFHAHGQRFFHHDMDTAARARLDYFAMIQSISVNKNCLRPSLLKHLFKVCK